jgi:cardiolipin synthase
VKVIMTNTSNTYASEFNTLKTAGVQVRTYPATAALYIHAKVIIADFGIATTQKVFVGSENFSVPSLTSNRELGLIMTTPAIINALNTTLASDFTGATAWTSTKKSTKAVSHD